MRARIVVAMLAFVGTAAAAWAQTDPGPATRKGLDAVRPVMESVKAGACDAGCIGTVAKALLASEHAIAVPWWLALGERPDAKPLPHERDTLARLRRAVEAPDWFPTERRVALRLIRQVESRLAAKDIPAARATARAARAFLGLVPDPALAKLLASSENRLPPPAEGEAAPDQPGLPEDLRGDAAAAYAGLMERGLLAYAEAGCRTGRSILARSIRDAAALLPDPDIVKALDRLRTLTATVEPKSGLTIFVRTTGGATLIRDGAPIALRGIGGLLDAEKHEPVTMPVLPGDLVTIAFDTAYASDEQSQSYVVAFHGRHENRDIPVSALFCDLSANPGLRGAPLFPVPIAKKLTDPPKSLFGRSREQDEALRAFNTYFELPKTTHRSVDVPCLGDMIMFLRQFDERRLAPTLVGTETPCFALVVRVPEP